MQTVDPTSPLANLTPPGVWEDFKIPTKSHTRRTVIFLIASTILIVVATIITLATKKPLVGLIVFGAYLVAHIVIATKMRQRQKRMVRQFIDRAIERNSFCLDGPDSELSRIRFSSYRNKVVKQLAIDGMRNVTVRTWLRTPPAPLVPLAVQFEPKHLNEAEATFREFHSAASLEGSKADTAAPAKHSKYRGTISRSFAVGGTAVSVFVFGIQAVRIIIESLIRRRFLFASVSIAAFAMVLAGVIYFRGGWTGFEYLIVPGGLLRRRSAKSKRHASVYLFQRTQCLLWIDQITRQSWTVCVGDENEFAVFRATTPETEVLLRAWLSPIDPPPLEKLKDFE